MKECFIDKRSARDRFYMPVSHSHVFYEMYILQKGKRQIYIENDEYEMAENDLIVIPAKTPHRTEGEPYTRYLVNFNEDYLDEFQAEIIDICQHQKISLTPQESERMIYIIESMLSVQEELNKKNHRKEYRIQVLFSYLIFELSKLTNFPKEKFTHTNSFSKRTKLILNYIDTHYDEPINLEMLCQKFFISKPALCNDFKKNVGMSIIDYLLKKRLFVAQDLLINSHMKISEIAKACGFSSQNYFNLIFTKHVKISPTKYRKTHK